MEKEVYLTSLFLLVLLAQSVLSVSQVFHSVTEMIEVPSLKCNIDMSPFLFASFCALLSFLILFAFVQLYVPLFLSADQALVIKS